MFLLTGKNLSLCFILLLKADFHSVQNVPRSTFAIYFSNYACVIVANFQIIARFKKKENQFLLLRSHCRLNFAQTNMAVGNRSERSTEEIVFSLENIETVNSVEGYNQEETDLSVTPLTEIINTNADQNEIEIIEYNMLKYLLP